MLAHTDSFGRTWTAGRAPDGLPNGTLTLALESPMNHFSATYGIPQTIAYGYPIYADADAPARHRFFVGQETQEGTFRLGGHSYASIADAVSALRARAERSGMRADTSTFVRIESVRVYSAGYRSVTVTRRDAAGNLFLETLHRPPTTSRKV